MKCFECHSRVFHRVAVLERGVPHGEPGHDKLYRVQSLWTCWWCRRGQLEIVDHDCWDVAEHPDLWWWITLDRASTRLLLARFRGCPAPADPSCACAAHEALRGALRDRWNGVKSATSREGAEAAARATLSEVDGALALTLTGEEARLRPAPRIPVEDEPPRQVRYYTVGVRPVRWVHLAGGGLSVQALDWKTGEFVPALEYLRRIDYGDADVDELDEDAFVQRVERLRGEGGHGDADLRRRYEEIAATSDPEQLAAMRRATYARFEEAHRERLRQG